MTRPTPQTKLGGFCEGIAGSSTGTDGGPKLLEDTAGSYIVGMAEFSRAERYGFTVGYDTETGADKDFARAAIEKAPDDYKVYRVYTAGSIVICCCPRTAVCLESQLILQAV